MKNTVISRYRPSVRIGNWFEDICLEEDEIQSFLKKRQKSELLIEKTRLLFLNFHAEVELAAPSKYVHFGDIVQILSCRLMMCANNSNDKSALSVIINEQVVRNSQRINDSCELTVAPSVHPCVRNSFKITSCDDRYKPGEVLKYGQQFDLQCVDAEEQPLVLYSMQKSLNLSTMIQTTFDSLKRGEINLPVALCLTKNTGPGKNIPSGYTKWCCYHPDINMRFEADALPVPSNTPLVITHSATNRNLAAENYMIQTLFGPEFLVSVQSYMDIFRRSSPKNLWIISINRENVYNA